MLEEVGVRNADVEEGEDVVGRVLEGVLQEVKIRRMRIVPECLFQRKIPLLSWRSVYYLDPNRCTRGRPLWNMSLPKMFHNL